MFVLVFCEDCGGVCVFDVVCLVLLAVIGVVFVFCGCYVV